MKAIQRYVLAGLMTVIPLAVTWFVFDFVLGLLAQAGGPAVRLLSGLFETQESVFADWLLHPWTQWVLAVLLTILVLLLLGIAASRVVGRRLLGFVHRTLARVPFLEKIYGGTKHFIDVMQAMPDQPRLAVLIEFPQPGMKALGFVMRTVRDRDTGEEMAVVFVPTTPVPTSGFLQLVPLGKVVRTDMSFDEAMTFIMTGGTKGPDLMAFTELTPSTPSRA